MVNLLPEDKRKAEEPKKEKPAAPVIKLHMPEVSEPEELPEKEVAPELPPAPTKDRKKQPVLAKKKTQPKRKQVLKQSREVLEEKVNPLDIFSWLKKKKIARKETTLNLLSVDESKIILEKLWQNIYSLSKFALMLIVVIGLAYCSIKAYQLFMVRNIDNIDNQIAEVENQISVYQTDQQNFIKLQQRAQIIEKLLNNHLFWTKFLSQLEAHTIPTVFYSDFASDFKTGVQLTAYGRDYQDVAEQLLVFESAPDFISDVEILSANLTKLQDQDLVFFGVKLILADDFLKQNAK